MKRLLPALLFLTVLGAASCRTVSQEVDVSDPAIKARIEIVLRGRPDLDLKYVSIDVNSGTVTISGLVPTGDQARIIRRLAANVEGVDVVLNNLAIQE